MLFHLVEKEIGSASSSRHLSITVSELADGIEGLRASGQVPISLDEYLGLRLPGPESFTVSFDDAHPSLIEHAVGALKELGVPATVFVPTEHVGETNRVMGWADAAGSCCRTS